MPSLKVRFRRTGASCQAAARGGSLLVERTSYSEAARSTACVDAVASGNSRAAIVARTRPLTACRPPCLPWVLSRSCGCLCPAWPILSQTSGAAVDNLGQSQIAPALSRRIGQCSPPLTRAARLGNRLAPIQQWSACRRRERSACGRVRDLVGLYRDAVGVASGTSSGVMR